MKKMYALFCMMGLLTCSMSSISVQAAEIDEPCTEIVDMQSEGLIYNCNLTVSNYNGSLCVNSTTFSPSNMEKIGLKDLIVEYSYNGVDWYYEWNAGDFLSDNAANHELSNYIISLERSGCYYHATCKHYAKKSFLNTQDDFHTSNSVWIPKK
ncbi:MAG: hypothetical protein K2H89_02900 [Oscillospiraceae bacterium]|nr:hypothetical protein [Oscillospiraceae bacterium]